jgi:deoxyribodipyrimidine photo-lyase
MNEKKKALMLFRRDLRSEDNTALNCAMNECDEVIPCFIFDNYLLEKWADTMRVSFLMKCLEDLDSELKKKNSQVHTGFGDYLETLSKILEELEITHLYFNIDYTPYAQKRDEKIIELCKEKGIEVKTSHDLMLNAPEEVLKNDGMPYTIFTPYYKKAEQLEVKVPQTRNGNLAKKSFESFVSIEEIKKKYTKEHPKQALLGGRTEALELLEKAKNLKNYKEERDFPILDATTHLSAHFRFGTLSPREAYYFIKENISNSESLIRQLYWHDFFIQIAYHFPHVFTESFNKKYKHIEWNEDKELFKKWCEGKTGFPLVDAAMKELNETGYMHNRSRMLVASFLTKDLHINWIWGERYFAEKLLDFDPCVNNGSWQWAASTGCDAQPYFRIFNPWRQQVRFDPEANYIKRWLPELKDIKAELLHKLDESRPLTMPSSYPKPIVNHKVASKIAIELFKKS